MSRYTTYHFLDHPLDDLQNGPNTITLPVSRIYCNPPRLIKNEHQQARDILSFIQCSFCFKGTCFFLSTAVSKTSLTHKTHAGPWIPTYGTLLLDNQLILSLLLAQMAALTAIKDTQLNKGKLSLGLQKFQVFHHAGAFIESRDVNLLPKWPTLICGQTKRLEWGSAR